MSELYPSSDIPFRERGEQCQDSRLGVQQFTMFRIITLISILIFTVLSHATQVITTFDALNEAILSNTEIKIVGTIVLSSVITFSGVRNITMIGENQATITTDGLFESSHGGLFYIENSNELTFTGLHFVSGTATHYGGCLYSTSSTIFTDNIVFTSCSAEMGGGLYLRSKSTATIFNGTFYECLAGSVSKKIIYFILLY